MSSWTAVRPSSCLAAARSTTNQSLHQSCPCAVIFVKGLSFHGYVHTMNQENTVQVKAPCSLLPSEFKHVDTVEVTIGIM